MNNSFWELPKVNFLSLPKLSRRQDSAPVDEFGNQRISPLIFASLNIVNICLKYLKACPSRFTTFTKFFGEPSFVCRGGNRTSFRPWAAWQRHLYQNGWDFLQAWMRFDFLSLLPHIPKTQQYLVDPYYMPNSIEINFILPKIFHLCSAYLIQLRRAVLNLLLVYCMTNRYERQAVPIVKQHSF